MGWGAMHIVQQWQERHAPAERVILVGAAQAPQRPGAVSAYRWTGGPQEDLALQQRIHEAVTGIVSLDNLLAIGSHFGIWPEDCLVAECGVGAADFGLIVIARQRGESPVDALGYDPDRVIAKIMACVLSLARGERDQELPQRSTADLEPVRPFACNRLADFQHSDRI